MSSERPRGPRPTRAASGESKGSSSQAPRRPRPTRAADVESRRLQETRRRQAARARTRLLLIAGVVMLAAAVAITARAISGGGTAASNTPTPISGGSPFISQSTGHFVAGQPVDGVGCGPTEGQITHIHQHLDVIVDGKPLTPPPYIGFVPAKGCLYWIHRHDDYPGVIHLEAPIRDTFNFGAFLDVWSVTPDIITFQGGPTFHVDKSLLKIIESRQPSVVAVDGQPYSGDIRKIVLYAHTMITLGYGVKSVTQQPFDFSQVDGRAAMPTVAK